jgi:hypothetical protein
MFEPIELGKEYLLDSKIVVKVLRSLNRSKTIFCVETTGQNILTVEKKRLTPIKEDNLCLNHSMVEVRFRETEFKLPENIF